MSARPPGRTRRRVLIGLAVLLIGPIVLAVEILIASRAERIDPFTRGELDGRVGSGDDEPLRITWIGDSTGAGVGAEDVSQSLPHLFAARLGRPVDLSVPAISGARVDDAVREQLPELSMLDPDWVVIGIGNNDVTHLTKLARFRASLETLMSGAAELEPERIIVLGTAAFAGTPLLKQPLRALTAWRSRTVDAIVREVAAGYDAIYVPIAADTGPAFEADPGRLHAHDGFHPSGAGYALWADSTIGALERAGITVG